MKIKFMNFFVGLMFVFPYVSYGAGDSCQSKVARVTQMNWSFDSNAPSNSMRSLYSKEELMVYDDTASLQKFRARQQALLKEYNAQSKKRLEVDIINKDEAISCQSPSYGSISNAGCKGKTIKNCDTRLYNCLVAVDEGINKFQAEQNAGKEYKDYMVQKICNGGGGEYVQLEEPLQAPVYESSSVSGSGTASGQMSSNRGTSASAQVYKGRVLDSKTREPLMYVNVSREGVTNEGTMTDDKGEFNTRFSDNKITFSYVGCQQITKELTTDYTEILMDCGEVRLDEVVVDFKKICESEPNNGTFDATNSKCICPEGRQWNNTRNECVMSSIPTLPSRGLPESNLPDKLEPRQAVATDKELCESPENAGQWNEKKNTCKCPEKKVWIVGDKKCEDADLEAMRQACWKLMQKGQTLWDEETNSCTCIKDDETVDESKRYEYDAKRKSGKCVEIKEESKPEPVKQTTKPKERTEEEKAAALSEKQTAYEDAKANEQSTANRGLTALTTAATGIGGMELAQGIAEKSADKDAQLNMDAYIATMRCTYGNGKSVKASLSEVELPGGNDATIMQYRNEYMTLASDLKQRKESLGMKPGIESEVIYDKSTMGLYDEENVGISGGNYASLYRAKMLGSESDQSKIKEEQETTSNRIKGGAIALGGGMAVGLVGDSLINGKLGEALGLRETKDDTDKKSDDVDVVESRAVVRHKDPEKFETETPIPTKNSTTNPVNKVIPGLVGDKPSGTTTTADDAITKVMTGLGIDATGTEREPDEPDVDASKWTESAYQQCFVNFFPNDKYSSNIRSYWAKSHNEKYCSGYTNGKYIYDFKKNPNPCTQSKFKSLPAGGWEIALRNGKTVKGIAVCNNTRGTSNDELRDDVGVNSNSGLECWCKITETDLSECLVTQKFSWEYKGNMGLVDEKDIEFFDDYKNDKDASSLYPRAYYEIGQNNCMWQCAEECAYNLFDYGRHRQRQMHGVPLIREYIESYHKTLY